MRIAETSFLKWLRPLLPTPAKTKALVYPYDFQTSKNREPKPPDCTDAATLWFVSFIGDGPSTLKSLGYMVIIQLEYMRVDGQTLLAAEHIDTFNERSGLVIDPRHSVVTVPRADYTQEPPYQLGNMILRPADRILWRNSPTIVDEVKEIHKLATLHLHFRRNKP